MSTPSVADKPPPSATSFFVVSGTLPLHSHSYMPRQADTDLLAGLFAGEYCFVLNSRQMGKSSLSVRTMAKLQEAGGQTVFLDLTKIGGSTVTPEQWYVGLLSETGRALGLRKEFLAYWKENSEYSLVQRYFGALHDVALAQSESRIVVFLDEIDAVKSLSFSTDEFFAAVRECYNRRVQEPEYGRLAFALVGSATPSDLIKDTRTSPFNVGKRIELKDFTLPETLALAEGIDRPNAKSLVERAFYWTNGHPFLTQALCAEIAADPRVQTATEVDSLVAGMFFEAKARERNVNLSDVSNRILSSYLDPEHKDEHRAAILDLYRRVWSKRHKVGDEETDRLVAVLKLSGITRTVQGELQVRNRIYARVFDRAWIETSMPDAELRRQKQAYRAGMLRSSAIAACIVLLMSLLAGYAFLQRNSAQHRAVEANAAKLAASRSEQRAKTAEGVAVQKAAALEKALDAMTKAQARAKASGEQRDIALHNAVASERHAYSQAQEAKKAANREKTIRLLSDHNVYAADMQVAAQNWDSDNVSGATIQAILNAHIPHSKSDPDLRSFAWRYQWNLLHHSSAATYAGHGAPVSQVAHLKDGRTLALEVTGKQIRLRQWRSDGQELPTLDIRHSVPKAVSALCLPDGGIVVGAGDGSINLLTPGASHGVRKWGSHRAAIGNMMLSSGEKTLITTDFGKSGKGPITLKYWDTATGQESRPENIFPLSFFQGTGHASDFTPDGRYYATASGYFRQILTLYDTRKWETPGYTPLLLGDLGSTLRSIDFSPDGALVAAGNSNGQIALYNVATHAQLNRFLASPSIVMQMTFSADNKRLAAGDDSGLIQLWDVASLQQADLTTHNPERTFKGHTAALTALSFDEDGKSLTSGGKDGTVKRWDIASAGVAEELVRSPQNNSVTFAPNGSLLATAGLMPGRLRDPHTGAVLRQLQPAPFFAQAVAFSRDSKLLALAEPDHVSLWDVATGQNRKNLPGASGEDPPGSLAFSPDNRRLVVGFGIQTIDGANHPQIVRVWDVASGRTVTDLTDFHNTTAAVAISPDGRLLAVGSHDATVRLYRLPGYRLIRTLTCRKAVCSVAFSPDSRLLATGDENSDLSLWEMPSGTHITTLSGHSSFVMSVAFSPDGRTLASGSWDRTVRLWDVVSRRPLRVLRGHKNWVLSVAFSPDGKTLLSGDVDGHVFSWETEPLSDTVRLERRENLQREQHLQALSKTGTEHFAAKQWLPAITDFTEALRLDPGNTPLRIARVGAYVQLRRWKEAMDDAERSLPLTADDADYRFLPGLLYLAQGDTAGYQRACDTYVRECGAVSEVAKWIGLNCATGPGGQRNYTRVLTLVRKQAALHPDDEFARLALGSLQYRAGQFSEAVQTLSACKVSFLNEERLLMLAMAQQRVGNYAAAKKTLLEGEQAVHLYEKSDGIFNWFDTLIYQLELQEAKALILPDSATK